MATRSPLRVVRWPERLRSDDRRVIPRYLDLQPAQRARAVVRRAVRIPPRRAAAILKDIRARFASRHRDLDAVLHEHYERAVRHVRLPAGLSGPQRLLVGAYFTMEYSIESAALFNPSIVPHPDQGGLPRGALRFLMSLRATGEGHVSSIVLRRGIIDAAGAIRFDPPPRYAYSARPVPDRQLGKALFLSKLHERGVPRDPVQTVLELLPDPFGLHQLKAALGQVRHAPSRPGGFRRLAAAMLWLAEAHYELHFPPDCLPSETVIFPATQPERQGMEDLRLVRFVQADGRARYYGTYTAYDGLRIHPMLLETDDFHAFRIAPLAGRFARNKGMALFPRQVDGHYLMLGRHDARNLHLLRSGDLHVWNVSQVLQSPREDWELVLLGNCGSPLETEAGWLVITHAVGAMRQYSIGAMLLDRRDPSRVIGRLRRPLLVPTPEEREGYVPNVVYSCGSLIHRGRLVIPYAMSDSRTSLATVAVRSLLGRLLAEGA